MKYLIKLQILFTLEMECEASTYEEALNFKEKNLDFDVEKEPWEIKFLNVSLEPLIK